MSELWICDKQVMDAWEKAVEKKWKWQDMYGKLHCGTGIRCLKLAWIWKGCKLTFRGDRTPKCKAENSKGPFIGLLIEVSAVGALFGTARQELEALQQAKDAEVWTVALESPPFVASQLVKNYPQTSGCMAAPARAFMPVLRAESLKRHILKMENEEEALCFSGSGSSSPSLLPKLCLDNEASLYPDIKISLGLLLAPAGEKGSPLPPRVTMTSRNFHAEQLRQLSMQDSTKPCEHWVGWVVPAGNWNGDPSQGWGWTDIPDRKNISPKHWCWDQKENLLPVTIHNECF